MDTPVFADKNTVPTGEMLAPVLGATFQFWNEIRTYLTTEFADLGEDWKCYGKKYGWQLKMLKKKRNLIFLIPKEGFFNAVFIFGDKAVEEIQQSDVPEAIKTELANAKKYMEGRGIKLDVKSADDVAVVKKLITIKVNN